MGRPVDWLGGLGITVVLGLVYGYIPYLILVLYTGLDRIDPALIEAGRDLGLNRVRTFIRVTLPLSRQAILTGDAATAATLWSRTARSPSATTARPITTPAPSVACAHARCVPLVA